MFRRSKWYRPSKNDYLILINIWEAAVRATHHFLVEEDIMLYKHLILTTYFDQLDLYCSRKENVITGFMGLNKKTIQMLFIAPAFRGQGIGKELIQFAVKDKKCMEVAVNEQNLQAVGFYEHLGFMVQERYEQDAAGKPYPVLAMRLTY